MTEILTTTASYDLSSLHCQTAFCNSSRKLPVSVVSCQKKLSSIDSATPRFYDRNPPLNSAALHSATPELLQLLNSSPPSFRCQMSAFFGY